MAVNNNTKLVANFTHEGCRFSLWSMPNGSTLFLKHRLVLGVPGEILEEKAYGAGNADRAAADFEYLKGKLLGEPVHVAIIGDGQDEVNRVAAQYEIFGENF